MTDWSKQWSKILVQKGITPTRLNVYKFFSQILLPSSAKILDVGCGSGSLAQWWLDKGYDILGVDQNKKALEITSLKGVKTQKEDVECMTFPDNSFDLVYSDGLLEHFPNCCLALLEIFRVSRNLVLTIVPRDCIYNTVASLLTNPPKEYKRPDGEWIKFHELFSSSTFTTKISFGLLAILCEKD